MTEIKIYGSQGRRVGDATGPANERIKDFFFDGVRMALQRKGSGVEAIVFFRARESEVSRSEQYYAVYEARSLREIGSGFYNDLTRIVEQEQGMEIVTTTDDTAVFQMLANNEQGRIPTNSRDLDDVKTILQGRSSELNSHKTTGEIGVAGNPGGVSTPARPEPMKIGVGSSDLSFGVLRELTQAANSVVIAENAESSRLKDFDVVIEKRDYSGLTLLGETSRAVEELRERRRKRRQQRYGADNTDQVLTGRQRQAAFGIGGIVGVALLALIALYASAFLGFPIIEGLPGMGGGGDSSPASDLTVDSVSYDPSAGTLALNLSRSDNESLPANSTVDIVVFNESGDQFNSTKEVSGNDYALKFAPGPLAVGNYTVSVTVSNKTYKADTKANFTVTDLKIDTVSYDALAGTLALNLSRASNESLPADSTVDIVVSNKSGEQFKGNTNVSGGDYALKFVPGSLAVGNYTVNVTVSNGTYAANATAMFTAPLVGDLEIRNVSYNHSADTLALDLTRPGNESLPANSTVDIRVSNESGDQFNSTKGVSGSDYALEFESVTLADGNYTVEATVSSESYVGRALLEHEVPTWSSVSSLPVNGPPISHTRESSKL